MGKTTTTTTNPPRMKNVKAITQGNQLAKAEHLSIVNAHTLSVTPCLSMSQGEPRSFICFFLILNIFLMSVPSLYIFFPVHKLTYCKRMQFYPPQAVLRKVKNNVDKVSGPYATRLESFTSHSHMTSSESFRECRVLAAE